MRPAARGFRVVDGLAGIAVLAFGLVWARSYWGATIAAVPGWDWDYDRSQFFGRTALYHSARSAVLLTIYVGATLAAPSGLALVAVRRARRPTPPFWRARRPGAMACLAASAVLVALLAFRSVWPIPQITNVHVGRPGECRYLVSMPYCDAWEVELLADPILLAAVGMPRVAGLVIGGAWLTLAMAGRWRPERSWVDRFGVAIGVFWIASAVHFLFFPYF